jgi:hypothetical protein
MEHLKRFRPSWANLAVAVAAMLVFAASAGALSGRDSVDNNDLQNNAVDAHEIQSGQVKSSEIATNAVRSSEIADGTVGLAEISDAAEAALRSAAGPQGQTGPQGPAGTTGTGSVTRFRYAASEGTGAQEIFVLGGSSVRMTGECKTGGDIEVNVTTTSGDAIIADESWFTSDDANFDTDETQTGTSDDEGQFYYATRAGSVVSVGGLIEETADADAPHDGAFSCVVAGHALT